MLLNLFSVLTSCLFDAVFSEHVLTNGPFAGGGCLQESIRHNGSPEDSVVSRKDRQTDGHKMRALIVTG